MFSQCVLGSVVALGPGTTVIFLLITFKGTLHHIDVVVKLVELFDVIECMKIYP